MRTRNRRKPTAGEILIIIIIAMIVVISCIIFIIRASEQDELSMRESLSDAAAEPEQRNESGSEDEYSLYNEPDHDIASVPVTEQGTTQRFPADRISIIDIAETYPDLKIKLDEESNSHKPAGVSLVIYDGFAGEFYAYQYGYADIAAGRPIDIDTKIRVASLSKLVVVICAMKLVDADRLDLDEDISTYLGYKVRSPHYPDIPITTRMLMQHTSSIHDSSEFHDSIMGGAQVSTQNLLNRSSSFMTARPGSTHIYTNFGYTVLGAVIEFVSGMKLDAFAREVLFDPLDIDAAFQAVNLNSTENLVNLYDAGHRIVRSVDAQIASNRTGDIGQDQHLAQGNLLISAFDFAKILAMLGNGGVYLGERILSSDAVTQIHHADITGPMFMQGLSSRFTDGGEIGVEIVTDSVRTVENGENADNIDNTDGADSEQVLVVENSRIIEDIEIWRYVTVNGSRVPSDGFFWHTGSAHGVFAQYIYIAGSGTNEGIGGFDTSRGVVVLTTGASTGRAPNGMIDICNHLSEIAWRGLHFDQKQG